VSPFHRCYLGFALNGKQDQLTQSAHKIALVKELVLIFVFTGLKPNMNKCALFTNRAEKMVQVFLKDDWRRYVKA